MKALKCDRCGREYESWNQKELGQLLINCGSGICKDCYKWLLDWFTPKEDNND